MSTDLTVEHKNILDRVAKENGFSNYELLTNPGAIKGGNFMGVVTAVTVQSENKKLDLLLKSVFTREDSQTPNTLREAYKREIYLYSRVFEEFKKFQEEYCITDQFDSTAKVYGYSEANGSECLLMENLKTVGYRLWDKTVPMNPEHIKAVLKEYAKFHAISLAMKHKNPQLFEDLTKTMSKNIFDNEDIWTDEKLEEYINAVMKDVYGAVDGDKDLTNYVHNLKSKLIDFYKTEYGNSEYKCVIDHGDCWCNNFMFKYQDSNNNTSPASLRIIDWQVSCLNSPASDFCYFFLVNSAKEILNECKTYLKLYYDCLSNQLKNFNCDPDEVFPHSKLKQHCDIFFEMHLLSCCTILKIMLSESEEAPDFSNALEDTAAIAKQLDYKMKNVISFNERVKNVVSFLYSRNN